MKRTFSLLLALYLCAASAMARTVVYPRAESETDERDRYPVQLLMLALREAHSPYELKPHPVFMLQVRAMREVEQGSGLDIVWTMTSKEREQALLPIRIPIDRGLLGWRLLLVEPSETAKFAHVSSLEQLKALRGGQGADWPDTTILRDAGLMVDESVRYGDLFQKLAAGRIDYFPRSVQEISGELENHRAEGFAIEPTLALVFDNGHRRQAQHAQRHVHRDEAAQESGGQQWVFSEWHRGWNRADEREDIALALPLSATFSRSGL